MTTSTNPTRTQIIDALNNVVAANSHLLSNGSFDGTTFDVVLAALAIETGHVAPFTENDQITDPLQALALGALMSDGIWWVKA